VRLRPDAFDYLQLPVAILEGAVGRLELQIPWGRWAGGPLVVRLVDVTLRLAGRDETDWEEGPALRRAQAAKQAQLAAAELAKLGDRVARGGAAAASAAAAPGAAAAAAAPAAAAAGARGRWSLVDLATGFLLNRLQFSVENVHLSFEVRGPRSRRAARPKGRLLRCVG
jgi:hypothetical protein